VTVNVGRGARASLRTAGVRPLGFILAALAFIFVCLAATASADESSAAQEMPAPSGAAMQAAKEEDFASRLTDPKAAAQLPHQNLDRAGALNLMDAVFGPELESPAGPFDDLHVEKFLSDNVAVIPAGEQPAGGGVEVGETVAQAGYEGPTVLESALPLRANGTSPSDAVDLGLERAEGELQPANPLAEVGIPQELGEGIQIPGKGIEVELVGAAEDRSPSIIDQSVAAYPNLAPDTSFAVAPAPTGFETMTILQSADSPTSQTFRLNLPQGAQLEETFEGGAIVTREGETLLEVTSPTAIDATGAEVPVSLSVSGDSLRIEASPDSADNFPILVDPQFRYEWHDKNEATFGDWTGESSNGGLVVGTEATCTVTMCLASIKERKGLDVYAKKGAVLTTGNQGTWSMFVPRYASDIATYGTPPQSFITSMVLQDLAFQSKGKEKPYQPTMVSGIWDKLGSKYTSVLIRGGSEGDLTNLATTYTFGYGGDENAKQAIAAQLYAGSSQSLKEDEREFYVGDALVEIGDSGKPTFGTPSPSLDGWVNNKATSPIHFTVSDAGLGVRQMRVKATDVSKKTWTTSLSCTGAVSSPCPRTWTSSDPSQPALEYKPSEIEQGIFNLELTGIDPAGNESNVAKAVVKVDHTPPSVTLSGSMTEQATIGTSRPRYVLTTSNTDGTEAAPQSGVVSTEIVVDGKKVDSTSAVCAAGKNCSVNRGWALESSAYSVGKHVIVAKATDAVGLTTEKTLAIEIQRDTTKPTIENFGSLYNAPDGWVEQKTYEFGINAWDKGYGVTALEFKMDGAVVGSAKTACPNGGCTEWLNVAINMTSYKGGAHTAAIVATDGAGNVTTETWTVNVNPKGEVSAAEAINTLKAVDATSGTDVVTPTAELIEPGELEEGNAPGLKQTGTELVSTSTGADTVLTTNPSGIVKIETGEGNINVDPLSTIKSTTSEVTSGSSVAVAGGASVDTVVRPIYDGLMTYQEIRDATAPQTYSWEVSLLAGQTLKTVDAQHVAIFNEDGTQALAIAAEASHDATGKDVPTELSVSGKVLTLTVKHVGGGFVYPIVGGPSFHASYVEPVIYTPPPPPPPEEVPNTEEEWNNLLNGEWPIIAKVSAPQMVGCPGEGEACASSSGYIKTYGFTECVQLPLLGCANAYEQKIRGFFYYNFNEAWESKRQPNCENSSAPTLGVEEEYCKWVGPDHQKYGAGYHITSQVKFRLVHETTGITGSWKYITVRMFGSGNAYAHQTSAICNPSRPEC
jgi:hypothetical protein